MIEPFGQRDAIDGLRAGLLNVVFGEGSVSVAAATGANIKVSPSGARSKGIWERRRLQIGDLPFGGLDGAAGGVFYMRTKPWQAGAENRQGLS